MDDRESFGWNVRQLRKAQNLSQEELAEKAGLHRTYIGSVERGERNISLENILALARALNVSLVDLFRGIRTKDEE
jgi:transcriptional regulator with XRE-family HTH domain